MYLVAISLLIVLWWIAVWGLIDICLHRFIKNKPYNAICIYIGIIVFVLLIVYLNPDIYERMV